MSHAGQRRYLVSPTASASALHSTPRVFSAAAAVTPIRHTAGGHQVLRMSDSAAAELATHRPDLRVEEDFPLPASTMPQLPPLATLTATRHRLRVTVRDAVHGLPLAGVTLFGIGASQTWRADTGDDGQAELLCDEPRLRRLIASPRQGHWSRVITDVLVQGAMQIELQVLGFLGGHGWGHRMMGFHRVGHRYTGAGVRIAIIDSGVSALARDVRVAGGLDTLDGEAVDGWRVDTRGHGTHCAGIAAASGYGAGVLGGAPLAQLFALKVLPGGFLSDLVEAIEWCVAQRIDVLSMSLGSAQPSAILQAALHRAYQTGLCCIAAAGNEAGAVAYPAAFDTVIAVSALGAFGSFPPDSAHALRISRWSDWRGELFAASFSNFGPEIAVCAPGVAVVSTVPTGYAAWDGTSMACPVVAALAALILQAHPWARSGDAQQPEYIRATLGAAAVPMGMPGDLQGAGLPLAPRALGLD